MRRKVRNHYHILIEWIWKMPIFQQSWICKQIWGHKKLFCIFFYIRNLPNKCNYFKLLVQELNSASIKVNCFCLQEICYIPPYDYFPFMATTPLFPLYPWYFPQFETPPPGPPGWDQQKQKNCWSSNQPEMALCTFLVVVISGLEQKCLDSSSSWCKMLAKSSQPLQFICNFLSNEAVA